MPSRNSIVPNHPTTPRRSPRLLQHQPYNPSTPNNPFKPKPSKSNHSTKKHSNQKSSESRSKSTNCTTGLRRSPRLNNGIVESPCLRRSPRFSNHEVSVNEQNGNTPSKDEVCVWGNVANIGLHTEAHLGRKQLVVALGGNVGLHPEACLRRKQVVLALGANVGLPLANCNPNIVENFSGDLGNSNPGSRKSERVKGQNQVGGAGGVKTKENSVEHCDGFAVEEGKARNEDRVEVGVKRKRNRKRKREEEIAKGWTKEQELALQRAYLAAKPSPHFWKNVSKLVPGKSQQECFDRIHRDHITPPQSHPRSRARTITSSPVHQFSISASKLLKPFDKKVRRSNFLKPKNYIAQKSVEKLLRRHLKVDHDHEGDIFSVLEPNIDFSKPNEALSTPKQLKENQGLLQNCTETSSSSHKKTLSRFSSSCAVLVSPPVLKQVKNRVLHEKYINQLRCRDARRRAASARTQVPVTGKISKGSSIQKRDVVKAAKVALVSEARDAINKFQQLQVNFSNTCSSDEDNDDGIGVEYDSQ